MRTSSRIWMRSHSASNCYRALMRLWKSGTKAVRQRSTVSLARWTSSTKWLAQSRSSSPTWLQKSRRSCNKLRLRRPGSFLPTRTTRSSSWRRRASTVSSSCRSRVSGRKLQWRQTSGCRELQNQAGQVVALLKNRKKNFRRNSVWSNLTWSRHTYRALKTSQTNLTNRSARLTSRESVKEPSKLTSSGC